MGSKPFSLATDDWVRIGRGFLLAAAGFAAAYITANIIPALQVDQASVVDMALVAVFSVVANALRLLASDTTK